MLFYTPIGEIDTNSIILAIMTMLGSFGGFPDPPAIFTRLTQSQFAKWALVWVLVYQGGGKQDLTITTTATAVGYLALFVVAPMLIS